MQKYTFFRFVSLNNSRKILIFSAYFHVRNLHEYPDNVRKIFHKNFSPPGKIPRKWSFSGKRNCGKLPKKYELLQYCHVSLFPLPLCFQQIQLSLPYTKCPRGMTWRHSAGIIDHTTSVWEPGAPPVFLGDRSRGMGKKATQAPICPVTGKPSIPIIGHTLHKEDWYTLTPHSDSLKSLLQSLGTSPTEGLSSSQAAERLSQHGENRLKEAKKKTNLQRFFAQFFEFLNH